jgi:signal transduction histidine kinase
VTAVRAGVTRERTERVWGLIGTDGARDRFTRVVAATPSLRRSWLVAIAVCLLVEAWSARTEPRLVPVFLVLAPLVPVGGVALAYGPWADPMFEVTQASPTSGFRVLLLRTVAVLGASGLVLALASLVLPGADATAVAWLLPALALSLTSLVLATFMPLMRSATVVVASWFVVVVWSIVDRDIASMFGGTGQLAFFTTAVVASIGLAMRRHHLEMEGLRSRRELLDATEAERRRIERNLHDGAQQQLVAIGVKASLASTFVTKDPERAVSIIDEVRADALETLDGLRDLARGAYPPILADEGLERAIGLQAKRSAVPVTLVADGVGRLPEPMEVAVYYCCLEAMQNSAKYSGGSVAVSIRRGVDELSFSVRDDGAGFDPALTRRGVGMRSMAERVTSLGGSLEVRSSPGDGTLVSARLPLTR